MWPCRGAILCCKEVGNLATKTAEHYGSGKEEAGVGLDSMLAGN